MKKYKHETEHCLSIYSEKMFNLSMPTIYRDDFQKKHSSQMLDCRIYIVGSTKCFIFLDATLNSQKLEIFYEYNGVEKVCRKQVPPSTKLINKQNEYFLQINPGSFVSLERIIANDLGVKNVDVEILYIGQCYGRKKKRPIIERILNHEKIQKIAILEKIKPDHVLSLSLVELSPARLMQAFLPNHEHPDSDNIRIQKSIDSLLNITELEKISLYEASLINYFKPKYNQVFKNSFPSTRAKILSRCVKNDTVSLVTEIDTEDMGFSFYSENAQANVHHTIKNRLSKAVDRFDFINF